MEFEIFSNIFLRAVSSTNYKSTGTIGQVAIGYLTASKNIMNSGFWHNFNTDILGCCIGIRGNVDGDPGDEFDIADIVYFVDWLFNDLPAPPCLDEANVKLGPGDEEVDIADAIYLVDFLFNEGSPLPACSL